MVWAGKYFKDHLVPSPPANRQGHVSLDQVA